MKRTELLDTYQVAGDDKFRLADAVSNLAKGTVIYKIPGKELTWYCKTDNGEDMGIKACPANPMAKGSGAFVKLSAFDAPNSPTKNWGKELWEESLSSGRLWVSFNDKQGKMKFLPVTGRIGSDFALLGITGPCAQNYTYHLLGLVSECLQDKVITLVCRKSDDVEKVISMRSDSYMYIPQDEAYGLASELGGKLKGYTVTNFETVALYEFPKEAVTAKYGNRTANFSPYIRYSTSDAGENALSFELGWSYNNHTVFLASGSNHVSRIHRGVWDESVKAYIKEGCDGLKTKFTVLRDKMDELSKITVSHENIGNVVKNLCHDVKVIGKKVIEAFVTSVSEMFYSDATAAEIILAMYEVQDTNDRLRDLSDAQKVTLKHQLGEMPYKRIRQYI